MNNQNKLTLFANGYSGKIVTQLYYAGMEYNGDNLLTNY